MNTIHDCQTLAQFTTAYVNSHTGDTFTFPTPNEATYAADWVRAQTDDILVWADSQSFTI